MKFPNSCILQFAKVPRAGYVKTRMIPALGEQGALQLHKKLVQHTWYTLNNHQLSAVQLWTDRLDHGGFFSLLQPSVSNVYQQNGSDLGFRMSHALELSLSQFESVFIVGSDCPGLDHDYMLEAFESLEQGVDVVIGPASDGGYVLIGMRRFIPELFIGIDWGSDQVFEQTVKQLKAVDCRWHELPVRWDVDRPEDLEKLAAMGL